MNRDRVRMGTIRLTLITALSLGALVMALITSAPFPAAGKKKKSKGSAYTCDIESVQKAVEKAGEKGIMKALGLKEHLEDPEICEMCGCSLVIRAWMAGHLTQSECAEVIVLYKYDYSPYEVAFLGLKGKKLKAKMKGIITKFYSIDDLQKRDIDKDGLDETLLVSNSGGVVFDTSGCEDSIEEPTIKKHHLISWLNYKPYEMFVTGTLWDDTDYKSANTAYWGWDGEGEEPPERKDNPPYTVRISQPVFIDLNGDSVDEIMVSNTISKYSDIGHKKLISKKDESMKTYFFNGKVFELSEGTAVKTNTADIKEAAKTAYNEGQEKFEAEDYPGALAGFKKALDILPNAFVYIKIASCYEKMQDYKEAANWLQKYVQEKPGAGSIADIQSRIKKLIADQPQADADIPPVKNSTATFPGVLFGEWSIQALDDEAGGGSWAVDLSQSIAFNPAGEAVLTVAFEDMDTGEEETSVTKRKWAFKSGAVHLDDMKCSILDKKPKKMTADEVDGTCALFVVNEDEILWWHEETGPVRMVLEKMVREK